jgi:hypothetical protein
MKLKKLTTENQKLIEDGNKFSSNKIVQSFSAENSNNVDYLRRQIRLLEDKLKKQRNLAEKPYVDAAETKNKVKKHKKVSLFIRDCICHLRFFRQENCPKKIKEKTKRS